MDTKANTGNKDTMNETKAIAIQFFKEKYNLDVEITNQKKLPSYVASEVDLEGHVVGHEDQSFNISVNYKTQKTSGFVMSPELEKAILANGFDPYK